LDESSNLISAGIELEDFLFLYVNNWYGIGIYSIKHYICREMIQIERHIKSIAALCRKYKVNRLFVFGSVLTDRFNDGSDIDMVVDFKKDEVEDYFDNYFDFKYSLQDLFGREVDLVEEQTIRNPYFRKSVDSTKQLIYG